MLGCLGNLDNICAFAASNPFVKRFMTDYLHIVAGYYGYWWSATESNYYLAYSISLFYSTENINWYENYKSNLYSVRCLLDR
ncbi:hypothetical protein R83H12_02654 [Fibrobacteria bacterium R8-3-H12]